MAESDATKNSAVQFSKKKKKTIDETDKCRGPQLPSKDLLFSTNTH